ncbi:MAG: HD domain-containing protein [Cytophagales bacterium]|nr:HD domain-containing protein [Cytophagales bacterium]
MPSLLPGFSNDIFLSYRHNDNRSGWVTEFEEALRQELAATIKDSVSVYFDTNPHDGLLETHNVDKSLEGKLKSLIFIPILSQTYCDPKSFAWEREFVAFNQLAKEDQFGRDIRLGNGNVASRILPVKIHDLDAEDQELFEKECDGVLRAVDFIFRSPGVNRPLSAGDKREDNLNKTLYRDQINKVANAIKEIISVLKNPGKAGTGKIRLPEELRAKSADEALHDKSIAVLPFTNLSQDPGQEYFADGIAENILMQLAGLPQFRVISRTSVMRYRKTTKSAPEIAEELGVKYILEGSAQAHKDKVRINIQLINARQDRPLWSKVFLESIDDIFEIQSSVAEIVGKELKATIHPQLNAKLKEVPTRNREAYDLFLKGRHAFNQWSVDGYRTATDYFEKAIAKDPEFRDAYSYLASSYSARMSWNGDLAPDEALKSMEAPLNEAWHRGASDNDYLSKAFIEFFVSKDFTAAEKLLLPAIEMNPNNASLLYAYSYLLNMMGRFSEAAVCIAKAKQIDPLTVAYFNYHAITLYLTGRFEEAIATLLEAQQLYPAVLRFDDFLGRIHLTMGNHKEAARSILAGFDSAQIRPPSMVAWLASAYAGMDEMGKSGALLEELKVRSHAGEKGVNIYLVHACLGLGDEAGARLWLKKARETNDVDLIWWNADPLLKTIRAIEGPDFVGAERSIMARLEKEMPNLPYHNLNHIRNVLDSAMVIASHENLPEEEIGLLRLAALLHDAGFIHSSRNHEQRGADMAEEILSAFGLNKQQIGIIQNMILATRSPQTPVTRLEKILCDADLDYLGREDFYEVGGKLLEELKSQGVVQTDREWNLVQKTFLESHRYHTDFSKTTREHSKNERLKEIEARLKA